MHERLGRPAALATLLVAATLAATTARAQTADAPAVSNESAPPPGGDVTGFWGGKVAGGSGTYAGRLVCLRNDQKFAVVGPAEECPSGRRVYALQRADGESTHPLLAADETMLARFDELRGRDVQLQGKLYDATGLILVSSIVPD